MAADIKYSRNELAEAMIRFDKVLEQLPSEEIESSMLQFDELCISDNYHALSRFIELSWREGTIVNADVIFRLHILYLFIYLRIDFAMR